MSEIATTAAATTTAAITRVAQSSPLKRGSPTTSSEVAEEEQSSKRQCVRDTTDDSVKENGAGSDSADGLKHVQERIVAWLSTDYEQSGGEVTLTASIQNLSSTDIWALDDYLPGEVIMQAAADGSLWCIDQEASRNISMTVTPKSINVDQGQIKHRRCKIVAYEGRVPIFDFLIDEQIKITKICVKFTKMGQEETSQEIKIE